MWITAEIANLATAVCAATRFAIGTSANGGKPQERQD